MDIIQRKLQRLERETTELKGELAACKQEVRSSREKIDLLENLLIDSNSKIETLEKKKNNTQCHCIEFSKELKSLNKRLEKMEKMCSDFNTDREKTARLQCVLNKVMLRSQQGFENNLQCETEDGQSPIDTQAEAASQGASHADTQGTYRLVDSRQEIFSVRLRHMESLKIGEYTKVSRFVEAFVPNTRFDKTDCVFIPTHSGVYGLNVAVYQEGQGEMRVWLGGNGSEIYQYLIGITRGDLDFTNRLVVLPLVAGEKYWVEVRAMEGNPQVWCDFSGFLMSQ